MPGLLRTGAGRIGGSRRFFQNDVGNDIRSFVSACPRQNAAREPQALRQVQGRKIAVLGGGIAGLTMALQLARRLPKHEIHLFEAKARPGGWVESERVKVDGETALVEGGPRSIRPAGLPGMAMMNLVRSLGLENTMISIPKTHPSAKNRYIYHSDKVNLLPNSLSSAILAIFSNRPPRLRSVVSALLHDFRTPPDYRASAESIEEFIQRRMGPAGLDIIDNVMSAVLHGIYAADAKNLGIRSIFGFLALSEKRHGGLIRAALPKRLNRFYRTDEEIGKDDAEGRAMILKEKRESAEQKELEGRLGVSTLDLMKTTSIFSFKDGIQELTDAIEQESLQRGIGIQRGAQIEEVQIHPGKAPKVTLRGEQGGRHFDRIVTAMPSNDLVTAWKCDDALRQLLKIDTSTVAVLNLAIRSPSPLPVPDGFGYLISRASAKTNTLGLLGVVFDSAAVPGQEFAGGNITKLTMMLGGPFYKKGYGVFDQLQGLNPSSWSMELGAGRLDSGDPDVPVQVQDLTKMALDTLSRHLDISKEVLAQSTIKAKLRLQIDCIPRYDRHHPERMKEVHRLLKEQQSNMTLVGASYTGVSVNDCVLNATRTAELLAGAEIAGVPRVITGLEHIAE